MHKGLTLQPFFKFTPSNTSLRRPVNLLQGTDKGAALDTVQPVAMAEAAVVQSPVLTTAQGVPVLLNSHSTYDSI